MKTQCTAAICKQLGRLGESPEAFAAEFEKWRNDGEYSSYFFGKDGLYIAPTLSDGSMGLRHVHLVPLANAQQLRRWNVQWLRRGRKTSDRVLVYAQDPTHGYLLIYILNEPEAHEVAKMLTPDSALLMGKLIKIAETFIYTGQIIG